MFRLSEEGQNYLLALSRRTIREFLETRQKLALESPPEEVVPNRGAFVTLRKATRLRGCIGYVAPLYPLFRTVIECSISAATQDPRFPPMQLEELPEIEIEISVLSPVEEVKALEDIQVGTHGLAISQKGRRGLLLPQVPVEYGWDRERFLEETCRKAGLPAHAWREGARIEYFTAFVFAEKEESVANPM
ncbi:MAG TPA: AmmeMemoRadiSam system protein A [Terriglobia bacterium]|nr:AmmeMemoRadiSam system protein A [Terriglobia bacterium]